MLLRLEVSQLALLADVEVEFGPGLNLLTGETGAGKSILVGALGLSLGARTQPSQVRQGHERARVRAVFQLSPEQYRALDLQDGASGPELALEREISSSGRAGSSVNGRSVSLGRLRRIGDKLVAVYGQHQQQELLEASRQLEILDRWAGEEVIACAQSVAWAHQAWAQARHDLAELERLEARGRSEQEYLRFQLGDLESAQLRRGEEDELLSSRQRARHAANLTQSLSRAKEALASDSGALDGLERAILAITEACRWDLALEPMAVELHRLRDELSSLTQEIRTHADQIEERPGDLDAIEERLDLIDRIKRRYGGSVEAALEERERVQRMLASMEDIESNLEQARARLRAATAELAEVAGRLSRLRHHGAEAMAARVSVELAVLGMPQARFQVGLDRIPDPQGIEIDGASVLVNPSGVDSCEFLLSANPGEPLLPLSKVASGGELSRTMLAILSSRTLPAAMPVSVFDEVDSGIGGEVASQVGRRLRQQALSGQVLVVTHLAQVACYAQHHVLVEKVSDPEGRSVVRARALVDRGERATELARMMSGGVTQKARARAEELLGEAASDAVSAPRSQPW